MAYTQIAITNVIRHDSYYEVVAKFFLAIPAKFAGKAYVANIGQSYGGYNYETADDSTTKVFTVSQTASFGLDATAGDVKQSLRQTFNALQNALNTTDLSALDKLNGLTFDGASWAA